MNFEITPVRDVLGTDVNVKVEAEASEEIARITVQCDDKTLCEDELDPPEVSYDRSFRDAARYTPGYLHKLIVIASLKDGSQKVASKRWTDA